MKEAIFFNGVYEKVLDEIISAQKDNPGKVFFLQPYSSGRITYLVENQPNPADPVSSYFSTTKNLNQICYSAKIIGWENKKELSEERLAELNQHIFKYQPNETDIYLTTDSGIECVNLISILDLKKISNQILVSNLVKTKDKIPLKHRTTAGGWSYVYELPEWIYLNDTTIKEQLDEELDQGLIESASISDQERRNRLLAASKKPEEVQVVSRAFKRNPDVIIEVLNRANGNCEHCGQEAPFLRAKDGTPYLEIHHWQPLAQGGEDTVDNAGALCPNCHRKVHYGQQNIEY